LDLTSRSALPSAEPIVGRPSRLRTNKVGLPESLVGLRPSSLPLPSNIRPSRGNVSVVTSKRAPLLPARDNRRKPIFQPPLEEAPEPLDGREVEILKLVAASTPSHRGAWKKDSKAWQLFVRRRDGQTDYASVIPEEVEDGDEDTFPVGILPEEAEEDDSRSNGAIGKCNDLIDN
jgi:hypothetical protein